MPLVDQELQEFEALLEYMLGTATHAKASKGEQLMRQHYEKQGWTVYNSQKSLTGPGPDAIIWKRDGTKPGNPLELRLVDNKSGSRAVVTCPSGLSARSLRRNLPKIVKDLLVPKKPPIKDAEAVAKLLEATWKAALRCDRRMPPGVKLYVTNACGEATSAHILRFPTEAGRDCPIVHFENLRIDKRACGST